MIGARIGFGIFGWLGTVVLLMNGILLSLWAILTTSALSLLGAFVMLALAFTTAYFTTLNQRREGVHAEPDVSKLWRLTAIFAGVLVVAIILTALVLKAIAG